MKIFYSTVGIFFIKSYWCDFCWLYYFIKCNYYITNNTFQMFINLASTCMRIPNIIFFLHIIFYWILTLTSAQFFIPLLTRITFLQSHGIYFINVFDSFIFVIIIKTFKFLFSVLFGARILLHKLSAKLQLTLHQSKLTIYG